MASQREIFSISGPIHLTSIDWYIFYFISFIFNHIIIFQIHFIITNHLFFANSTFQPQSTLKFSTRSFLQQVVLRYYIQTQENIKVNVSFDRNNSYHRTSVASCLVQAVYTLERDRQQNRIGLKSQANHWWEFFNFTLAETLIDDSDGSIYGAVFEYKHFFSYNYHNAPHSKPPPRHVIAFRGTIMKRHSRSRDLKLDLRCVRDSLHDSTRFVHAIQVIQSAVAKTGNAAVWLAGHSLGAAVALLAGKIMTRSGFPLESYLFNPPFSSIPIEKLVKSEKLKHGVRFAGSLVKAGVAIAVKGRHHNKVTYSSLHLIIILSF